MTTQCETGSNQARENRSINVKRFTRAEVFVPTAIYRGDRERSVAVPDFFEVLFEPERLRVAKCRRRMRFNSAIVCGKA
jgi:hypothetical protein